MPGEGRKPEQPGQIENTPETRFTLQRAPRTSQRDIELPFGWENQEHDEIRRYRPLGRHTLAARVVSCRR
jgi:hypothetical protein